jgi:putative ABC transport system permease protein
MSESRFGRRRFRLPWRTDAEIADEVDEEIDFHLAMRSAALEAEGLTREQADARARREFGDLAGAKRVLRRADGRRERGRRGSEVLAGLSQDARYAVRTLLRSRVFSAMAVLTLALGIGATTTIFSLVDGVLLRPLPYAEPDRLVRVWDSFLRAEYVIARDESRSFEALAGYEDPTGFALGGEGEAERVIGARVTANLFATLGVAPRLGRGFLPGEDGPEVARATILSDGLWRSRFGGDPAVVGRVVDVDGERMEIIGVMGPELHFPAAGVQLWLPLPLDARPAAIGS